jgi:hypothetical protein
MISIDETRYRLSIGFTERSALLDFIELLKRGEFLPPDAEVRRLGPDCSRSRRLRNT